MNNSLYKPAYWKAVLVFMLVTCITLKGQENPEGDFDSDPDYLYPGLAESSDINVLQAPEIKKVSFSFSTGMMLVVAGQKNYFTTAYAAPAIAYNISPRLRIRAGSLIFLNSFYGPSEVPSQPGPSSRIALFLSADYFINDRVTLTGTYYKIPEVAFLQPRAPSEVYNRNAANYYIPSESMSLGLHYKITQGFSVGAEFRISNHYQPSLNPYPFGPVFPSYDQVYW